MVSCCHGSGVIDNDLNHLSQCGGAWLWDDMGDNLALVIDSGDCWYTVMSIYIASIVVLLILCRFGCRTSGRSSIQCDYYSHYANNKRKMESKHTIPVWRAITSVATAGTSTMIVATPFGAIISIVVGFVNDNGIHTVVVYVIIDQVYIILLQLHIYLFFFLFFHVFYVS